MIQRTTHIATDPLIRACFILHQKVSQRPHGQWEVDIPSEPTEYPALTIAFNAQLPDDWQHRIGNSVSVHPLGVIPKEVRGKKDDSLWLAELQSVLVECRELVAVYSVEAIR